jgi:hypothetical protein
VKLSKPRIHITITDLDTGINYSISYRTSDKLVHIVRETGNSMRVLKKFPITKSPTKIQLVTYLRHYLLLELPNESK